MILFVLVPVVFLLITRKNSPISFFLFVLFLLSLFCGYIAGYKIDESESFDILNIYILCAFVLLYMAFYNYKLSTNIIGFDEDDSHNKLLIKCIFALGIFCLAVNLYTLSSVFKMLIFLQTIDVSSYKNGGEGADIIKNLVSPILLTISRMFSPLGYIGMALHFYYLTKKDKKKSILSLAISSNILLVTLINLSRSSIIQYSLLYTTMLILVYPCLDKETRKKSKTIFKRAAIVITSIFLVLTMNRFSEGGYTPSEAKVQNPIIFTLCDYAGQGTYNSIEFNKTISNPFDATPSLALLHYVRDRLLHTYELEDAMDTRDNAFGVYKSIFINLPVSLRAEYGTLTSEFILLLIYIFIRLTAPRQGLITIGRLTFFGPFIVIIGLSLLGNELYLPVNHIAVIYCILFNMLIKHTKTAKQLL